MVGAGSKDETPEKRGISHFLEHMAFKGTKKRPSSISIAKELDKIGAKFNANTSKERTYYWIKSAPEYIDLSIDILYDITFNSLLRKEDIDKEKGVIFEEINRMKDDPAKKIWENYGKAIFGDTPIGWDIIGTKKTVKGLRRKDFIDYKKKMYVPSNMILSVAGNIKNPEKIMKVIIKTFKQAKLNRGKFTRRVNKNRVVKPKDILEKKNTEQTQILVTLPAFSLNDKRMRVLNLIGNILAGNMSSRLFIKIRKEKGWAYSLHNYSDYMVEHGVFGIYAGLTNNKAKDAIKIIKDEIINFADTVTEEEVQGAKGYYLGRLILAFESDYEILEGAAGHLLLRNKLVKVDDILNDIKRITLKDVKSVANQIFDENEIRVVGIGPNL